MNTRVKFQDIPAQERKRLEVEAYRQSQSLRRTRFTAVLIPILLAGAFSRQFVPAENFVARLLIAVLGAVLVCLAIWECFGRPKLKAEVERLKNT